MKIIEVHKGGKTMEELKNNEVRADVPAEVSTWTKIKNFLFDFNSILKLVLNILLILIFL